MKSHKTDEKLRRLLAKARTQRARDAHAFIDANTIGILGWAARHGIEVPDVSPYLPAAVAKAAAQLPEAR